MTKTYRINDLGNLHPRIRADDWRSPLIHRLLQAAPYRDGQATLKVSYRPSAADPAERSLNVDWSSLKGDHDKCINTYQAPVLTEFAALGAACLLTSDCLEREITEVTRRGEKADYWVGGGEYMLEVSGQQTGSLERLRDEKRDQLQENPFGKAGFVCVTNFEGAHSYMWFYEPSGDHDDA